MNDSFIEIYDSIKKSESVLIMAHQKPDGDAIGSMLALKLVIERMNVKADTVVTDIPDFTSMLPNSKELITETNNEYDLIILVDVSSKKRLGNLEYLYNEDKKIIIFDHHEVEMETKCMHYIDPSIASTTLIIYKFIKANKIEIDNILATYLYVGLLTDTGGFAYQNTSSEAFNMAADLLTTGINHSELYTNFIKKEYNHDYLLLEKTVIDNLEIINNSIAYSFLNNETISKYKNDAPKELVNLGRYLKGVEVSIIIIEEEINSYRVSLRSKNYVDVSEVAKKFNGGGHKRASGIKFIGDLEINKEKIINEIIKFI